MHITARLDEATLRALLDELLPVTILLDDEARADGDGDGDGAPRAGRWVAIEPAQHVDFVAGEGLRLRTAGRIRWTAAGLPIEATLHAAQVMLRPQVVPDRHGGRLVFRPSLEEADLKNVPALVDRGVAALVNRALESRGDDIAWDFGQTLGRSVHLPRTLAGLEALQLGVNNAAVTVTHDAIELNLTVSMHFLRTPAT
jgi:hypothetical protein